MAKIKMIAVDLDGTLFDDTGKIPIENKKALQEAYNRGICIVLSSGRMTDCVIPTADILGIDCSLIVYNGAMVKTKNSEGRKIIFHKPLQIEYCDMLIDYTLKNNFHLNYYLNDVLYAQDNPALRKYADIYAKQTDARFNFVSDLSKFKGNSATKLILITNTSDCQKTDTRDRDGQYNYFYPILGKEVNITKTNPEYLEFMNKEVDKGIGLVELVDYYRIDIREVIAFGDGDNDASLVASVGIGVAMANASEKTKKSAKIVAQWTNNESGVAKILMKYL